MKNLKILFLLSLGLLTNACKENQEISPQEKCYKCVVIGPIRSWGGGIALSMESNDFSSHTWRGYSNVVEALQIDAPPNTVVYINARYANDEEKKFTISTDGDESAKPIIVVTNFSLNECLTFNSK